ncbi:RimJ/RimL family protein N-acetyltransferase [Gracilibacillus alcaliphilus]|nr:RimJ/RimL family protein N-acetyltransferase [Gracilibacillus alcaliphilus]
MEVMNSTNPFLDIYSLDETRQFVEGVMLGSEASKSYIMVDKQEDTPFGIISLIHIDYKNRNAECIIDIGDKTYWGRGYGKEALTVLLDYAFLEMNLHRISLRVFSFNDRAIHLYRKMGFQQEGISRQSLFRGGKWHDIIQMGILQNEYIQQH